jgi:hypothetical protein
LRRQALAAPLLAALGLAAADPALAERHSYSAPIRESARQLYWGDTHLHTTTSADAYTLGTRLTREDAYRFARGQTVVTESGMEARLRRPLDFLAITDHAEYMGVFPLLADDDQRFRGWPLGGRMAALMRAGDGEGLARLFSDAIQQSDPALRTPASLQHAVWREAGADADRWNAPGIFTALIGYEWTSMVTGDNLHRVVLFRDGAETTRHTLPFSAQQSTDPEDLWDVLERYEDDTGGRALAIAHNGNLSNGRMFSPLRLNGDAIDRDYASRRARWEPVYEVTQVKGDGETHPALSPDDPFADFETWDDGNITLTAAKTPEMLPYEYARSALREGLRHRQTLGVNPFQFGMIGSSDMHTGLSTTEEDNYFGKFPHDGPAPGRMQLKMAHQLQKVWRLVSAGLAAVWSESNTRAGIFDALERREVYATTGSRIRLRLFGGWDFTEADLHAHNRAGIGYARGVPMGGQLGAAAGAGAPRFMIMASRDPLGANLDRVQVVKGWLDRSGVTHEQVYDVALSGNRAADDGAGPAPDVGSTVDLETASWSNAIGAPVLETLWTDPAFDPGLPAFWYVRVLEIPTPRWTAYDVIRLGDALDEADSGVVRERAYSSPIWYQPAPAAD